MLNHAFARKNHRYSEAYLAETIHLMEIARAQRRIINLNQFVENDDVSPS